MKERRYSRLFLVIPVYIRCWNDEVVEIMPAIIMEGEISSSTSMGKSKKYLSRSDISKVMERLIRTTFKSVTQMFAYKDFEDVEIETELEIGLPTDVKHVTHIGYDGSVTTNPEKNWDHLQPPETLCFPSVSLEQLELQMAKIEKQDP